MALPPKVTRWLPTVKNEIKTGKYPFAPELILALIWYESRGTTGATNPKSGASGLMQVMPATLDWYNQQTGSSMTLDTLRNGAEKAARAQIRVGLWVLGRFWRSAYKWIREKSEVVPVGDLVRFGDAYYAGGPGRVRRMAGSMARSWDVWATKYPESTITKHAAQVWEQTNAQNPTWDLNAIDQWVEKGTTELIAKNKQGLIIGLIIILVAVFVMKGKES